MRKEQLCWDCKNACANSCCWMRDYTPVPGWKAQVVARKKSDQGQYLGKSYFIVKCPNFVKDTKHKEEKKNGLTISEAVRFRIDELLSKKRIGWKDLEHKAFVAASVVKTVARCRAKSVNVRTIYAVSEFFNMTVSEFFDSPIFNAEKIDF